MPERPGRLLPAIYGGIIMGVISSVPFLSFVNCLCCAGILFGGFMSVFFFKNDLKPDMTPLTSSDAVQLGALSGVFGAIVSNILGALIMFAVGNVAGEALYKSVIGLYDSLGLLNQLPPDTLEKMEEGMKHSGLSLFTIFFSFIIDPLFGLLGGLIGYTVFKPKPLVMNTQPPAQM